MISAARRAIVERQEKVSEMVRAGLSTTQIAQELKVTERTVQRDKANLNAQRAGYVDKDPSKDKPTCGQPEWHHDLFYCGRGCPWWPGNDEEDPR